MDSGSNPLVVIVGETASGKSDLAMEVAERFDGEIICADALTVRKHVDIGTAKPTAADRARVPHHLLDVVEPCEDFTAAVFKEMADRVIQDISTRGKLPIMAGGTGLYVDSVLYDYSFLPAGNRKVRQKFEKMTIDGLLKLAESKGMDTGNIDIRNKRRLMRLLETDGARPSKHATRPNTLVIGIRMPREELKKRVEARVHKMIDCGLEQEVRHLADKYGWQCEALKGIGYREWRDYFGGTQNLEETKEKIIRSTLNVLAKKQRTWFRRNKSIQWIDNASEAFGLLASFLHK